MKKYIIALFASVAVMFAAQAQSQPSTEHISKLEIGKKAKKTFNNRDSSMVIHIDTLIMGDRASLMFYGKKDVTLVVKYAEIGNQASISGTDGKNNGTNFDIQANIQKLGSLYLIAKGDDAFNGTKTFPNGNGGNVKIKLDKGSIKPQQTDKKAKAYLFVDVEPGGRSVNPNSDLRNIYSRIKMAPSGLRGLPQGQIYSGSPGTTGKIEIISIEQ
ncbi:hypothetical protein [Sphingobacterium spiritivorum]|uniref:Uncharacterized protein n=1 Tax=Sphingobacterium spiritivorum ATCC 33861 TaxID=525373 RepID=D7VSQ6_SPHSI|nr:hypothetical protein [Sphingobacterium spiritivorum]EFK56807.1 hypothetical protein HMPREF0766_14010 [Sphingobacterium spiritivorum ATCC 33861]QQT35167.1 hypothetical protein I6J01_18020 [Sphingobacterium spiritivorum]WQD36072.1 hypothetical protein U0038_09970 [Sphingobacterium spiritivorum]SUJ03681.1 Uncharacterised protein [Sphingobacterium spiritivorum]